MARFAAGARSADVGTTLRPWISLWAASGSKFRLVEAALFNTADFGVNAIMTTLIVGQSGSALTATKYNPDEPANSTVFNTDVSDATLGITLPYTMTTGQRAGAGITWKFASTAILIPFRSQVAAGIILESGTGQIVDTYLVWDE